MKKPKPIEIRVSHRDKNGRKRAVPKKTMLAFAEVARKLHAKYSKPKPLKIEAVKAWRYSGSDTASALPSKHYDPEEDDIRVRIIRESDFRKLLSAARRAGVKVEVKS